MKRTVSNARRVAPAPRSVKENPDPHAVRAALMRRGGQTIASWARDRGLHRPNVSSALHGKRKGPQADAIRAMLRELIEANY